MSSGKIHTVLGIESSCDETAIAVVVDGVTVRSSVVASQIDLHKIFGGVVPEVASRNHLKVISQLYRHALDEAQIAAEELDAIAVTQGPGLIGSLLVGATFAKALGLGLGIPVIPINHVHAHVHGALLSVPHISVADIFPCLALVISGGHTHIYRLDSPTSFKLLAYSLDDACGESFDKVAKLLGLPYPGGPQIETLALRGIPGAVKAPKMIEAKKRTHLSYSGLKTFVYTWLQQQKQHLTEQAKSDLALAFQEEALGQICRKTAEAYSLNRDVKTVLVAGGVAANQRFRTLMAAALDETNTLKIIFPDLKYCSDNAAMIATLGYYQAQATSGGNALTHLDLSWDAFPRYVFPEEGPVG